MILHQRVGSTRVNGPGRRCGLWVQGCSLSCPGCWNPQTHAFSGIDVAPEDLVSWILAQPDIEGVTFSGGEPMQQASSILAIMRGVRAANPLLTFGMFTGYTERELDLGRFFYVEPLDEGAAGYTRHDDPERNTQLWGQIRPLMSFVVAGRFVEAKKTQATALRSSTNQQLLLPDGRYEEKDFQRQAVEVKISPGGLTQITGFPIGVPGL